MTKQPDCDTKPFAEDGTDHRKTSSELKSLIDGGKVKGKLPTAIPLDASENARRSQSQERQRTSTRPIIKPAHGVALFESYASSRDDPELKQWAANTLPQLKEHLSMAEKLK